MTIKLLDENEKMKNTDIKIKSQKNDDTLYFHNWDKYFNTCQKKIYVIGYTLTSLYLR